MAALVRIRHSQQAFAFGYRHPAFFQAEAVDQAVRAGQIDAVEACDSAAVGCLQNQVFGDACHDALDARQTFQRGDIRTVQPPGAAHLNVIEMTVIRIAVRRSLHIRLCGEQPG